MAQFRQIIPAEIRALGEGLGEDEVEVVMSTGDIARDGHVLDPGGADLASYRSNPVILWQHDPKTPVATATDVAVDGNKIRARIRFASVGISHDADRVRGLVKDGIINAVSVGFDPLDGKPLDPKKPKGGQHFTRWALLECSFVSIPADPGALVTAREHDQESEMPDTVTEISTTEQPQSAAVAKPITVRAHRGGVGVMVRGLYEIGRLAWLLDCLCDAHYCAQIESALEGDDSAVPGMIAKAMQDLGAALIAMTEEEVKEALAGTDVDDDDGDGLDDEATTIIVAAKNPGLKRFLTGKLRAKSLMLSREGKKHSQETQDCVRDAMDMMTESMAAHRSGLRAMQRCMDHVRGYFGDEDEQGDDKKPGEEEEDDRAVGNGKDQKGSKTVQTSDGVAESGGSENDRAVRLRELEQLERAGDVRATYRDRAA